MTTSPPDPPARQRQRPGRQGARWLWARNARVRRARARAGAGRPQDRRAPHRRGRAGAQVQRRDRRGGARHRGGRLRAHAQPARWSSSIAIPAFGGTCGGGLRARERARHLHGLSCATTAASARATSSASCLGQLLGHGDQAASPRISRRSGWPPTPMSTASSRSRRPAAAACRRPASTSMCCAARMAGYARHANLAGVLIVGLGCERNQVADLVESQGLDAGRH